MPYGRRSHFLQVPGPPNVPDRVLSLLDPPTIDPRIRQAPHLPLARLPRARAGFHPEGHARNSPGSAPRATRLPPGLWFNAVSAKAIAASKVASLPRNYWRWDDMLSSNTSGFFPFTPATNLLFGLREALRMLEEEGLESVYERHLRLAEATRRA